MTVRSMFCRIAKLAYGSSNNLVSSMIKFLFWNLNNKPLGEFVKNLALRRQVDVLMLAECSIKPETILELLNPNPTATEYYYSPDRLRPTNIRIFTRFSDEFINPVREEPRITVRHVQLPARTDFLLVVAHLPSQLRFSDSDQESEAVELGRLIREV